MRTENWNGYDIRFIEINGEWLAILKDICDALKLRTAAIAQRLNPDMLERVCISTKTSIPSKYDKPIEHKPVKTITASMISKDIGTRKDEVISKDVIFNTFDKHCWMLAVNELGIYEALFASRKLEARKFRMWAGTVMQKLRVRVGLQGYEVMRMTDQDIQDMVDDILDTLFYDDEKKMIMRSVTVQGGDVEQIPFE